MTFRLIDIIQHLLNIAVLYLILRALLYKPVRSFMQGREARLEKQREEAKAETESAKAMKREYEEALSRAKTEAQEIMQAGVARADSAAKEILEKAQQEGAALLAQVREQAERERREIETAMKSEVTALAIGLAAKIIEREISIEDNREIIEQYFSKVG